MATVQSSAWHGIFSEAPSRLNTCPTSGHPLPLPLWYQDFTCLTFIDDSPPLQTWGANNTVVDSLQESDRCSGRVVLGTAAGDLYVFIQRGVRLIPREVREHAIFQHSGFWGVTDAPCPIRASTVLGRIREENKKLEMEGEREGERESPLTGRQKTTFRDGKLAS